jgi:lysophospholipase L1-like esterase
MPFKLNEKSLRKLLAAALLLNLFFIAGLAAFIIKKGGTNYIKEKMGLNSNTEKIVEHPKPQRSHFYSLLDGIYNTIPVSSDDVVFFGDSHFQLIPWMEFLSNSKIKNRGIGGDNLQGMADRVKSELSGKPFKIFISAGTNNINEGESSEVITKRFSDLINAVRSINSQMEINLLSILPIGKDYYDAYQKNLEIAKTNFNLEKMQSELNFRFIDLYSHVKDDKNYLRESYSYDGLHLNPAGYMIFKKIITSYL